VCTGRRDIVEGQDREEVVQVFPVVEEAGIRFCLPFITPPARRRHTQQVQRPRAQWPDTPSSARAVHTATPRRFEMSSGATRPSRQPLATVHE